jgi:excisionase family DNA binding protein
MDKTKLKKQAKYYASLPYTISVERRDDQGTYYAARYLELADFIMTGSTPDEAVRELESEKLEWFEENLKDGNQIPLPHKSDIPNTEIQKATYTVNELAVLIGSEEKLIYRSLKAGEIPHIKLGRKYVLPKKMIDGWLAGRK